MYTEQAHTAQQLRNVFQYAADTITEAFNAGDLDDAIVKDELHGEWYGSLDCVDHENLASYLVSDINTVDFEYLGSGAFSIALRHVITDLVLKISLGAGDTAPAYWQFCLGREDEYLPKSLVLGESNNYKFVVQPLYTFNRSHVREYLNSHPTHWAGLAQEYFPAVLQWARANKYDVDLHHGNVAFDADNNLIALDPVSIKVEL